MIVSEGGKNDEKGVSNRRVCGFEAVTYIEFWTLILQGS
jgi:hypothetical protein